MTYSYRFGRIGYACHGMGCGIFCFDKVFAFRNIIFSKSVRLLLFLVFQCLIYLDFVISDALSFMARLYIPS